MDEIEEMITVKILDLQSKYIDCDESGLEGIQKAIGKKLEKLNKCLEILNS